MPSQDVRGRDDKGKNGGQKGGDSLRNLEDGGERVGNSLSARVRTQAWGQTLRRFTLMT
jgi:hypothetical protein